ncbi:MAG: hypothetical protein HOL22_01540 [Euryarchaeota archaeon]|jgi:hypothetical protein|nr:hypothetical protein [Euryarchaeota archaeon]MBT5595492.1 hypothetical protein [Euryarchaeota archaeon]MBT5844786.1 hypothetical protein [Euryarchaeota archaeon]MBT6844287.1 hypothetical protein [Euryarchaeota archaeon]MBT7263158.1 hypothetical protein [Euryarchaeota archaeon]
MDGMHMVERKQDALSTNFLLGLMDDEQEKKDEIHIDVRKAPNVKGDQSIAHLANRIVDEVRVTTPRQRAQRVLDNAGLSPKSNVTRTYNTHLQHVGQRARKMPLNQEPSRRIRKVKKQPEPVARRRSMRGPPQMTRSRPSIGMEDEVRRSARDKSNAKGKRRKRRSIFRR